MIKIQSETDREESSANSSCKNTALHPRKRHEDEANSLFKTRLNSPVDNIYFKAK